MLVSSLLRTQLLITIGDYDSAEAVLSNRETESLASGFKDYLGKIYEYLAKIKIHRGDYLAARNFFFRSYNFYFQQGAFNNCKEVLNTIGTVIYFEHFRNYDSALLYYKKALKIKNKDESTSKEFALENLSILTNKAKVYAEKKHFSLAFDYFKSAANQLGSGIVETELMHGRPGDFFEQAKLYYRVNLLIERGNAYKSLFESQNQVSALKEALYTYKIADRLLDRIKAQLTEFQSRLFWREYSKKLYENAIAACYMTNDVENAFYFFEKSRAVLLSDQLNEQKWLGEADILKQTELQKRLEELNRDFSLQHIIVT